MTSYEQILYDVADGVATVTLNRPHVHNALDRDLSEQLNHAVREIRDDLECRVVVFQGAGRLGAILHKDWQLTATFGGGGRMLVAALLHSIRTAYVTGQASTVSPLQGQAPANEGIIGQSSSHATITGAEAQPTHLVFH